MKCHPKALARRILDVRAKTDALDARRHRTLRTVDHTAWVELFSACRRNRLEEKRLLRLLVDAVQSQKPWIRIRAVCALLLLGDEASRAILEMIASTDEARLVRAHARIALLELAPALAGRAARS